MLGTMTELGLLLARAVHRAPLPGAGKSGASLERLEIDGRPYVLKRLAHTEDWTMRAAGSLRSATLVLWQRGLFADLPDSLEPALVAVAASEHGSVLLMHDVSALLVPGGDEPLPLAQHRGFLDHMAALHAAFWQDPGPRIDVVPTMHRYLMLSPWLAETEARIGSAHLVPRLVGEGWARFADVAPRAAPAVLPLARDPSPLVEALESTPQTLVHGDWKLDNLGTDPTGRTVLLDWVMSGRGPALSDLAWYLAINCRRLPEPKEQAIAAYRAALEACGVSTDGWWDRQLGLCLLGALVQFGWEKALGGYDAELAWWEEQALRGFKRWVRAG
jgi:hypothetical protein